MGRQQIISCTGVLLAYGVCYIVTWRLFSITKTPRVDAETLPYHGKAESPCHVNNTASFLMNLTARKYYVYSELLQYWDIYCRGADKFELLI